MKRAVVAGRFPPIPRKYSDGLGRVISQMLRVSARERPTAEGLLRSAELSAKLQLDEHVYLCAQPSSALMETIKVPGNLRQLNCALPKACYPDVRPNSPTSWTVAEQKAEQKYVKKSVQPPPTIHENYSASDLENVPPISKHGNKHHPLEPLPAPPSQAYGRARQPPSSKPVSNRAPPRMW